MFFCCEGFLIYTTDTPGSGHYMTDKHYRVLMDLFYEERQARIHLEDVVTPMQRELFNRTQLATFEAISKTKIQKDGKGFERYHS